GRGRAHHPRRGPRRRLGGGPGAPGAGGGAG
ncbi:MAG: hypothetical protein AVDCRST_MAG11-1800, partial [uncultured Gemmatimonadaceae bacterium]